MSLARALTKRMRSQENVAASDKNINRAFSTRKFDKPIDRSKISLPLELISSTNALAYDAPDIRASSIQQVIVEAKPMPEPTTITTTVPRTPSSASSASSTKSYQDSLRSPGLSSASSVTSHEASRESSPIVPDHKPETFFLEKEEESRPKSAKDSLTPVVKVEEDLPNIPQRALSHTKKTHQALARQRSQRISSPPPQPRTPSAPATRSSIDMFSAKPEADHPFGAELQKVNELAEEFGMKDVQIVDEESQYLINHGFHLFSAEEYMQEIQPLFAQVYSTPVAWL
ncbi:MAG: hypothetical protein MMC23_007395 [Stictis urceolatum]|nr:hypothetical protein [Stictis urceolata]